MNHHILDTPIGEGQESLDFTPHLEELLGLSLPAMGLSLKRAGSMDLATEEGRSLRKRFLQNRGFRHEKSCDCHQIHSRKIHQVDESPLQGQEGDGLVTRRRDWILTVTAADCMPVFLIDPVAKNRGLCHSGWKGTGIAGEVVCHMVDVLGSRSRDIVALLGPSIGSCCYRVDEDRWRLFRREWGEGAVAGAPRQGSLSLGGANLRLLEQLGVGTVVEWAHCTACDPKLGSFRREKEEYTKMMAYLGSWNN